VLTYTTLNGQVLDLDGLSDDQQAFLERCYAAYRADIPWEAFLPLVTGVANPLVRSNGGLITKDVTQHPLYRAVRDLEARLGIRQGKLAASPGDNVTQEPLDRHEPAVSSRTSVPTPAS